MEVVVSFFAAHRTAAGERRVTLDVDPGATVGDLLDELMRRYPGLEELRSTTVVSRNHRVAEAGETLVEGDEIALLSPVGGG